MLDFIMPNSSDDKSSMMEGLMLETREEGKATVITMKGAADPFQHNESRGSFFETPQRRRAVLHSRSIRNALDQQPPNRSDRTPRSTDYGKKTKADLLL